MMSAPAPANLSSAYLDTWLQTQLEIVDGKAPAQVSPGDEEP